MQKITRRESVRLFGAATASGWFAASAAPGDHSTPPLAPGAPNSTGRVALIDAFKRESEGLVQRFAPRTHKGDWAMPYRLFSPQASSGKLPLVVYLHGSGGLGDDNEKQMGLGNIFGTRVWALPENQKKFPCYVVAPQTDRGWNQYAPPSPGDTVAKVIPGLGDGSRLALEIVDLLCREFPIDDHRIYVTGQSMGGAGSWNVLKHRPRFFAAAAICCASTSAENGTESIETPIWNFHGDADNAVPVSVSRDRMSARRKAGGHPLSTEYAGVDHSVWQWAYTEPELIKWIFAQRRA